MKCIDPPPWPAKPVQTTAALRSAVLILVVEVDPYIRALQRSLLEEEHQLEFAGDGEAALALARTLTPRLLLADILVPKIDGLRVCRELKRDPRTRDIRVAIFSELYAERRAYEAGADYRESQAYARSLAETEERFRLSRRRRSAWGSSVSTGDSCV